MTETSIQPRQSWWRAAPLPEQGEGELFEHDAMLAHFAAMYRAHSDAYHEAVSAVMGKRGMTEAERAAAGPLLRAAIVQHLHPSIAAWTVAALLKGMSPEAAWESYEDPQFMAEVASEWLIECGFTGDQARALTTVPVKGEDGLY